MKRSNLPAVGVMLAALFGSVGAKSLWQNRMLKAAPQSAQHEQPTSDAGQVKKLDSFALGLLLGGLRGPLVMVLWSSSESQKSERELEDFDTKIELIRLLQPEFDTVHLFQIWNKAYNISVQVANLSNKYSTILDAIDYAKSVLGERPDNINVVAAVGGIYFEKLGTSAERDYYRERVRTDSSAAEPTVLVTLPVGERDTFAKAALAVGLDSRRYSLRLVDNATKLSATIPQRFADLIKAKTADSTFTYSAPRQPELTDRLTASNRRVALDPMLDDKGMILADYLKPHRERPSSVPVVSEKYIDIFDDGSELGFLKPFAPFPQGISPIALAYAEFKKTVYLQDVLGQQHIQISARVLSSRPATALRTWSEEELQRGRRYEIEAFGAKMPLDTEPPALENVVADIDLSPLSDRPMIEQAIVAYDRSGQVAQAAIAEFRAHINRSPDRSSELNTYASSSTWMQIVDDLAAGDAAYLRARLASEGDRKALMQTAANRYAEAQRQLMLDALRYYTPPFTPDQARELNVPVVPRTTLDSLNRGQLAQIILPYAILGGGPQGGIIGTELVEYMTYVQRVTKRLNYLETAGVLPVDDANSKRPSVLLPGR